MRLKFNAPVTLIFSLFAALLLLLQTVEINLTAALFTVPGNQSFDFGNALDYFRLFSHLLGHADWGHLLGNFSLILLLGPILEERHGAADMIFMILVTAGVTGIINALFFPTGLLGASGIVFMMIILSSFTNIKSGDIPITFLLITMIYLGKEFVNIFQNDQISQSAHIIGGIAGGVFGFLTQKTIPKPSETA